MLLHVAYVITVLFRVDKVSAVPWKVQSLPSKSINISWPETSISPTTYVQICARCSSKQVCRREPAYKHFIHFYELPCRDYVTLTAGVASDNDGRKRYMLTQLGRASLCQDKELNLMDHNAPFPCITLPL